MINNVIIAIHNIFIHSPALAIWGIVTYPVPNTMVLGGVATGSMKASDEDMAAAIINPRGSIPSTAAREAVTGSIIVAVAVFEVISVRNIVRATTARMIIITGMTFRKRSCCAIRHLNQLL